MDEFATNIYKDRIKYLRHRIVNVGALLLIFIITLILIFLKQNNKLKNYKERHSQLIEVTNDSLWGKFEILYNSYAPFIKDYNETEAGPYSLMCMVNSFNMLTLTMVNKEKFDNPTFNNTRAYVDYAAIKLSDYLNALRQIEFTHNRIKNFNELNKEELKHLLFAQSFENRIDMDSLREGIKYSWMNSILMLHFDKNGGLKIDSDYIKERLDWSVKNLDTTSFTLLTSVTRFNHLRASSVSKEDIAAFTEIINNNPSQTFKEAKSNEDVLKREIQDISKGENIKIPIINFNIMLSQIVLFGGLINLGILLYFYFMSTNLKILSHKLENAMNGSLSLADKQALFFGLDYQIKNKWLYVVLNVLFFSALPIFSIILSNLIFKNDFGGKMVLITIVCVINIYVSVIISKILFLLNKD
ncbi:hypothetical protein [uncultured Psychroserpens sp.]|uniref:hypothetical protein n=1 Tax=uncultured Psychroserpens sp. TaxID=255436 RepID=UPI002602C96B|nr:hypothetical protein [uncultured Psychroserpens sp.]